MDPLRYRGGSVKYGWKLEGRYLVPHPHEQAGLAMAREMRATGLPYRVIAATLTERGFLPRQGERWYPTQIKRLVD